FTPRASASIGIHMKRTFRLPSFSVTVQVALAQARIVARWDFRRAVAILQRALIALDSAIAIVARFVGAASKAAA
ncbi:MAG: hypothetical protein ABIP42_18005, partial [Planctomycetota bacterium]